MKPGSRILITGEAGSCGRYVTSWLLARGHAVRVIVPREEWKGSAFLADPWELSDAAARELLGCRPMHLSEAKTSPKAAILACSRTMTARGAKSL